MIGDLFVHSPPTFLLLSYSPKKKKKRKKILRGIGQSLTEFDRNSTGVGGDDASSSSQFGTSHRILCLSLCRRGSMTGPVLNKSKKKKGKGNICSRKNEKIKRVVSRQESDPSLVHQEKKEKKKGRIASIQRVGRHRLPSSISIASLSFIHSFLFVFSFFLSSFSLPSHSRPHPKRGTKMRRNTHGAATPTPPRRLCDGDMRSCAH